MTEERPPFSLHLPLSQASSLLQSAPRARCQVHGAPLPWAYRTELKQPDSTFPFAAMTAAQSKAAPSSPTLLETQPTWKIKLLYDGECPLCLREVNFLQKKDAGRGLVAFVDVADDDYDPAQNGGIDFETAMGVIHAVLPDGSTVKNVEVFRRVYDVLGMGWVYAVTRLPLIGPLADWVYGIWAAWRLRVTGRGDLAAVVAERERRLAALAGSCDGDSAIAQRCRLEI